MNFSDTTNKSGIIQFIESLCKLGDGGVTNDATLLKQITGYINQAQKKVAMALLRVDKHWKFDDGNWTDFPIATITLVANQRDYTLPTATSGGNVSSLYKLNRVRVLGTDGLYRKIELMDSTDEESQSPLAGTPTKYRLIGNSIRLNYQPTASYVTLVAGLEVEFQRASGDFVSTDTTKQPSFMDSYHDLLAYDASASFLMPVNQQLAINYMQIFRDRLDQLQDDYANNNDDVKNQIIVKYRSSR